MLTLPDGSTLTHALDFAPMPEEDLVNAIVLTLREGDTACHDQTIRVRRVAVGYSVKIDGLFAAHASTMADLASAMHTARCLARRRAKWKDAAGIYALMAGAVGGLWGWHWLAAGLLLAGCSTHHIPGCRDSAVLPEAGVVYDCPPPTTVAIHEAEAGPVVMCLCPGLGVLP